MVALVTVDALAVEVGQMRWEWRDFKDAQAKGVTTIQETQVEHGKAIDGLRTDVGGLQTAVTGLGMQFNGLRTEVTGLRTELNGLRTELRTEVSDLRETQAEHGRILHRLDLGMIEVVNSVKYLMREREHGQSDSAES